MMEILEQSPLTAKEKMLEAVRELPDEASYEDAMERLLLLAKIERGLIQAEQGSTLSHDAIKERMARWLK
jgi:hypothetical protein